jgi:hypothetical protein
VHSSMRYLPLAALFLCVGCRPKLAPDADAILYYFRNARVQGEVKRVCPEGQKYVDNVLRADSKVRGAINTAVLTVYDLWWDSDPRWEDKKLVVAEATRVSKFAAMNQERRETFLADLQKAIEDVPAGLNLSDDAKAVFVKDVWKSLCLDGWWCGASIHDVSRECNDLLKAVGTTYRKPSPGGCDKSAARLAQWQDRFLSYAERELTAPRQAAADREARHQVYRRAYLRKELEAIPKRLSATIEEAQREAEQLKKPLPQPLGLVSGVRSAVQVELDWREELIKRLREEHENVKARVDEILKKSKTAG